VQRRWSRGGWGIILGILVGAAPLWSSPARAGGVVWQPGFPMRAGRQVLLMWMPVPGAREYQIRRRDLGTGEVKVWRTPNPQYVDSDAPPDRSFLYVVEALLPDGRPGPSSDPKRVEGFRPLEPPRWGGHYQSGRTVQLVWEPVEEAVFYNLYRAEEGHPPALLASVQDLKYVDAGVEPGKTYVYTVRAVDAQSRESRDSEPLTVRVRSAGRGVGVGRYVRVVLEPLVEIRQGAGYRLREPTDVEWSQGVLFVTDLGSRSVLVLDPEGDFLYRFAEAPADYPGVWGIPWGIDVSPDGDRVAVTFLRSARIRVFSRDGGLLEDWEVARPRGFEESPGVPQPMDVAWGPDGNLWVTDYTYAQVVRIAPGGREVDRIGRPRPADTPGPFGTPTFITANPDTGQVFVVDSLAARVFVLDSSGAVVTQWAGSGSERGRLDLPKGICVGRDGDVLVVDGIRSTLQGFSPEGALRSVYHASDGADFFGAGGVVSVAQDPRSGDIFLLSKVDSALHRFRVLRTEPAER